MANRTIIAVDGFQVTAGKGNPASDSSPVHSKADDGAIDLDHSTRVVTWKATAGDGTTPGTFTPLYGEPVDHVSDAHVIVDRDQSSIFANSQNIGTLTTGLMKETVSAGVATISTAVPGTDYQAPLGHILTDRDQSSILPNQQNIGALSTGVLKTTASGGVSTVSSIPDVRTAHVLMDRDDSALFPNGVDAATITNLVTSPARGQWIKIASIASGIATFALDAPSYTYAFQFGFLGSLNGGGLARGHMYIATPTIDSGVLQNVPLQDSDHWSFPLVFPGAVFYNPPGLSFYSVFKKKTK
jgi:hypothetical protein